MKTIQMYADLLCPFAYVVHATWRHLRPEYENRIEIVHRSLSLEYVNRAPTPKNDIDTELPVLILEDPDVAYVPWQAPLSEWPVTMLPAFEAVICAAEQSLRLADDLAWSIRLAIFRDSQCISMRHVLLDLARSTGLDFDAFQSSLDGGAFRSQVIEEARYGWEEARIPGSPTWVLPGGELVADFGLADIQIDNHWRPTLKTRGLSPSDRHAAMRQIIDRALSAPD